MKEQNSIIIPSRRLPIDNFERNIDGMRSNLIHWDLYGAKALDVDKNSQTYMSFMESSYITTSSHGYTICVADIDIPTITESYGFVQRMMKNSNFANADKIKFVLYRNNTNTPFAVVVEDF